MTLSLEFDIVLRRHFENSVHFANRDNILFWSPVVLQHFSNLTKTIKISKGKSYLSICTAAILKPQCISGYLTVRL